MYRTIKLASERSSAKPQAVALFLFDAKTGNLPSDYAPWDKASGGLIRQAIGRKAFCASLGVIEVVYPPKGPSVVFLVGLGAAAAFGAGCLRIAAGKLATTAYAGQVKSLGLELASNVHAKLPAEQVGMALADGLSISAFDFVDFKGSASKPQDRTKPGSLVLHVAGPYRAAVGDSLTVGRCLDRARVLAATPPNVADPDHVVSHCRKLAREVGISCKVIGPSQAKRLGMEGILAVGRAGSKAPAMICLEYRPRQAARRSSSKKSSTKGPILLVGKAVTFDTGGYSLKPDGGKGMKYDKCGGVAVIGAMEAIARLKVRQHVVGLIPCVENMIDQTAYRPDDILKLCNGVTVEVTNTDAEGRIILADALAYGTGEYKPSAVIDVATLTGGVVVALGSYCAGLFCNDAGLRRQIEAAGAVTGDRVWHLPLWPEHREQIKSRHGDIVNSSAKREAHPIQGAAFLSYFVGPQAPDKMPTLPWAHLDIAGVASTDQDGPLFAKGPTGFGVRLLANLIANWQ